MFSPKKTILTPKNRISNTCFCFLRTSQLADAQKTAQTHLCTRFAPVGKNRTNTPTLCIKTGQTF